METVYFITHPDVLIDPATPVPEWRLSPLGMARMRAMLKQNWIPGITHLASSAERKATDGAAILAEPLGLVPVVYPGLGENDRSSTGYLPKQEFEALADKFFASPMESVEGWERAIDAQARIVDAVRCVLLAAPAGNVAIISHGGVGALLLCHLKHVPISRAADQPPGTGGFKLEFDRASWIVRDGWRPIDG